MKLQYKKSTTINNGNKNTEREITLVFFIVDLLDEHANCGMDKTSTSFT